MDLGKEMKEPGAIPASPVDEKQPKITYPGFSLSDKTADQFTSENSPKLGEEYTATVRLRVTSLSSDEWGSRVGFDVTELNDVTEATEDGDEKPGADGDTAGEEKTLGYKRKKTAKETPSLSAKDLIE
jgi:hypothetical protein